MQLRTICLCRLILMLRSKINPEEPHKERKAQVGLLFLCDRLVLELPAASQRIGKENLDTALHFPAGYLIIGKKGQESKYSTSLMRRGVYGKSIQYHSRL